MIYLVIIKAPDVSSYEISSSLVAENEPDRRFLGSSFNQLVMKLGTQNP